MNLGNIERSTIAINLENIYDSNKIISINLKPELDLKENIKHYFDKAKSERKDFDTSKILLSETIKKIERMKVSIFRENEMYSEEYHPDSTGSTKSKEGKKKSLKTAGSKFRQFILYEKHLIVVGKNSKNNDELTTGFAKQNDYWFHARSVSGSHVVLRYDKSHGEIQKIVLEKAASIAAYYSKAKTSGLVPVSFTQKKYVVKRKGMPPGTVALLKEKVLIVKPEIPKECKLIIEE
jgi:predicted ribosome quality control (RQC) complex YloA/Tae2 family protein